LALLGATGHQASLCLEFEPSKSSTTMSTRLKPSRIWKQPDKLSSFGSIPQTGTVPFVTASLEMPRCFCMGTASWEETLARRKKLPWQSLPRASRDMAMVETSGRAVLRTVAPRSHARAGRHRILLSTPQHSPLNLDPTPGGISASAAIDKISPRRAMSLPSISPRFTYSRIVRVLSRNSSGSRLARRSSRPLSDLPPSLSAHVQVMFNCEGN
jgi:hypothetical protein